MKDNTCVTFLQWLLPQLNMRWRGFRKVRRQVCKRIDRRISELCLKDVQSYRTYLEKNPGEWKILDQFCRVTISRFYRDRSIFDFLGNEVLPVLETNFFKQQTGTFRVWSAGCASGEEPYTLSILWHQLARNKFPDVHPEIIATDIDRVVIQRAQKGRFPKTSLRELPPSWQTEAFTRCGDLYSIKNVYRSSVSFFTMDIRHQAPDGRFHLILCRNLAFTYFDNSLQGEILHMLYNKLATGGFLIIGSHETLPACDLSLHKLHEDMPVYQKYPRDVRSPGLVQPG